MKPPTDLIDRLNTIEWRKPTELSSTAEALIGDFLAKARTVIKALVAAQGVSPGEAFDIIRTAGPDSATHKLLIDSLFNKVGFRGAGVRETLIFPIVSFFSWDEDAQLSQYSNPWSPLWDLYKMGYTSDFDVSPDWREVNLIVGYDNDEKPYRIV